MIDTQGRFARLILAVIAIFIIASLIFTMVY
jgi:hypothetical protein